MLAPAFADDAQQAADDVCQCYEQSRLAFEELAKTHANVDLSKMSDGKRQIADVLEATEACFAKLPVKYPNIDKDEALQEKVTEIAKTQCPNRFTR